MRESGTEESDRAGGRDWGGLRRTRQRAAVLAALQASGQFLSAQELHRVISKGDTSVGLTTVYRTVRDLAQAGRIDMIREQDGSRLYRHRRAVGHSHYLVCRCCLRSWPVDSEVVELWAEAAAESAGFTGVEHTVELTGICAQCVGAASKGEPPCRQASGHPDDHPTSPR
ncbi:Fur family transcriptional regulator [Kribbella sp.]|uniref:Fur family transcriptional regulator n=1 Tax=Kribbella sp. TaxID=1871183 RepID=UPI002D22F268|nr:Fur family transcriptional regulator [Kribbella sp.]HZX03520.1 Fur family transcriptional regulator [Kribbella sp.]